MDQDNETCKLKTERADELHEWLEVCRIFESKRVT
jgi:hypothetical protein